MHSSYLLLVVLSSFIANAASLSKSTPSIDIYPSLSVSSDDGSSVGNIIKTITKYSTITVSLGAGLYLGKKLLTMANDAINNHNDRNQTLVLIEEANIKVSEFTRENLGADTANALMSEWRQEQEDFRSKINTILVEQSKTLQSMSETISTLRSAMEKSKDDEPWAEAISHLTQRIALAEGKVSDIKSSKQLPDEEVSSLKSNQERISNDLQSLKISVTSTKDEIETLFAKRDREILEKVKSFVEEVKRLIREGRSMEPQKKSGSTGKSAKFSSKK
jgi:hypothetical protein